MNIERKLKEIRLRLATRMDEDGEWITTKKGNHVHLNENGQPDKGNPKVIAKMKGKLGPPAPSRPAGVASSAPKAKMSSAMTRNERMHLLPKAVKKVKAASRKLSQEFYGKNAQGVAMKEENGCLRTFTSHGLDHVDQVIERSNQAANEIEKLPRNPEGFNFGKISRKTLTICADFHDTGMDGGNGVNYAAVVRNHELAKTGEIPMMGNNGVDLRSCHALNSAIHILENSDRISSLGENPSAVALIAFAHTKSMSGITDLSSPDDWKNGLENLQAVVDTYNRYNKENGIDKQIKFDSNSVFGDSGPTVENIGSCAATVAALRLGDANREANAPLKTQTGMDYNVDRWPREDAKNMAEEVADSMVTITEKDGKKHALNDVSDEYFSALKEGDTEEKISENRASSLAYSNSIVLGERNMAAVKAKVENGALSEVITLADGKAAPYCTTECVMERLGELDTINGVPRKCTVEMTGVDKFDNLPESAKAAYKRMWNKVCTGVKNGKPKFAGLDDVVLKFGSETISLAEKFPGITSGRVKR